VLKSAAFAVCFAAVTVSAKDVRQVRESGENFVGAVGCKSSSCHGGAGPKRSQFITWSQQDFHSRAYAVLVNARSARIAETLGLPEAQTSARCTVCHSPLQSVAPARLAPTAHPDEGVSCESCHGAASGWLRGHTRTDWTYNTRVAAGMRDLRNLYVRANACVACHQNLEPDVLRAGHPELRFELDSQSVAQPKHWRDEDPWIGARSWLTGQAVALREMSWALAQHTPDERGRAQWNALAWVVAKAVGVETGGATTNAPVFAANTADFLEMQRTADELARNAPSWPFDEALALRMMRAFASTDAEFAVKPETSAALLGRRAERLVLALERLAAGVQANGGGHLNIENELKTLAEDLRPIEQFDSARFAAHLQALSLALAQRSR
jgi:hypothetical protein